MPSRSITQLLVQVREGAPGADRELLSAVYDQLRQLAGGYMRRQASDHTLQPTALINEAYIKLFEGESVPWQDREHFFASAAQAMRHALVDHARARQRDKRGGDRLRLTLTEGLSPSSEREADLLDLDGALTKLSENHPRAVRVVELRFFAGMTIEQAAAALGVDASTVERDWRSARTWLLRELSKGDTQHPS